MGVVHCVYVWVLTDYKYVITSLVAQNSTQKTKQFWKGEANFQFIYYTEKRRSAALKCMSSFFCECFFMILVPSLWSFWLQ